jgi:hypothetical protein
MEKFSLTERALETFGLKALAFVCLLNAQINGMRQQIEHVLWDEE